jgi:HipA-like protein
MISILKKIIHPSKTNNLKNTILDTNIEINTAQFTLSYKSLNIGTLEFSSINNSWSFSYSEDFKNQIEIVPIISFPDKNKIYHGKELWSFFTSRIPDNVGSSSSESKSKQENNELIQLLQSYGKKTITNPFNLSIS